MRVYVNVYYQKIEIYKEKQLTEIIFCSHWKRK